MSTVEGVDGYVAAAIERYGTIDLFHNNAALEGPFLPLIEYDVETFDRLVAVNVRGVFLGLRPVIPILLEKGSGAYTATKHVVAGFTRAAAMEVATTGVRINAVCPGVIDTEFVKRIERANAEPWGSRRRPWALHGLRAGATLRSAGGDGEGRAPPARRWRHAGKRLTDHGHSHLRLGRR